MNLQLVIVLLLLSHNGKNVYQVLFFLQHGKRL